MGEAIGIIGTLFVVLYFSRKQTQSLSIDIETKVLNDLAERLHGLIQIAIERPQLTRVISKVESNMSPESCTWTISCLPSRMFFIWQRKVLSDNEWTGWLRWMNNVFQKGEIMQIWKSTIEMEKWFVPAFQEFVDKELIPPNTFSLARTECYI